MAEPFGDAVFAVVDVETTGIHTSEDRVIEVAVLEFDGGGTERRRWSTLVRPDDRPLEGRLTALVDAPTFGDIAGDLCAHLSTAIVAGHNVKFDLRMVDAELQRLGHQLPELTFLDTHAVATKLEVDTPNRSLAVLCAALDVPFATWHTAEGDVEATAALLIKLLERAAGWGRTNLDALCGTWHGTAEHWPTIPATGRSLRRDPVTFPPGGRQPQTASAYKPSWRRHGTGDKPYTPADDHPLSITIDLADYDDLITQSTIASVTELIGNATINQWPASWPTEWVEAADYIAAGLDDTGEAALFLGRSMLDADARERSSGPTGQARSDWYAGDFQADTGITRLQHIIATLDPNDDEDIVILIDATAVLADLYRRHGGRHDDVVTTYNHALQLADTGNARPEFDEYTHDHIRRSLTEVVRAWWDYTHKTRDVTALTGLYRRLKPQAARLGPFAQPTTLAANSVLSYAVAGETVVADELYRFTVADPDRDPLACAAACERLADAHAKGGRTVEALALCEQAWQEQFADQNVANRHSLILERANQRGPAADVAARGLQLDPTRHHDALTKRLDRCRRRTQDPAVWAFTGLISSRG